jgi:hypothetical protein
VTFVRGYADGKDYSKGYVYNFEEGAAFIIPHAVRVLRQSDDCYSVQTTGDATLTVARPEK